MPSQDTPTMEANGALVATAKDTAATTASVPRKHQTDGAYVPITGPITNVRQLMRGGKSVAKGAIESFETLDDYSTHLRKLTTAALNMHAVEEARIVPIDDKDRLIRRLENNWTEVSARERGRVGNGAPPKRADFTQEQKEAQENLRRKMLRGRA